LLLRVERTLQRGRSRYGFETNFRRAVSIAASLLMVAPASALACPVCGLVGTSDNTWAYQAMSAILTLLPLAMIGATVWWLARVNSRVSGPAKAGHSRVSGPLKPDTRASLVRLKPDTTYE
jgi:hypothetical protein